MSKDTSDLSPSELQGLLQLHSHDNVAVALRPLSAGTTVKLANQTITLQSDVSVMHKIAIQDIPAGQPVIKYGQPIGNAMHPVAVGENVHNHNCEMANQTKDFNFCSNVSMPKMVEESERAQFMGYHREGGRIGTRNFVGIITTVNCSATVASHIAGSLNTPEILKDYPNVDGVVALTHEGGCGMKSSGEGYELLERVLTGYAKHPNFGGVLIIGLGCETMQIQRLINENALHESPRCQALNIQDAGGTRQSINKGIDAVKSLLATANLDTRAAAPASHLTVALQCGGSDAFSGVTANPALGAAADLMVSQGGTVIYSETPEIYGAEHLLTQRSTTPEVANAVLERIKWWENYTEINGFELNNNPSPGNKLGGLTTIAEKSLGAQSKSGTSALQAVYLYAEPATTKGLVFMDSPGFDPVSVTGQVASGANVICFTTGRGSAFGFKPVPCIKLGSNNALYEQMADDIDVNCGEIISGKETVAECGQRIFQEILDVASGKAPKSESFGYGLNEFNPWRIGATV